MVMKWDVGSHLEQSLLSLLASLNLHLVLELDHRLKVSSSLLLDVLSRRSVRGLSSTHTKQISNQNNIPASSLYLALTSSADIFVGFLKWGGGRWQVEGVGGDEPVWSVWRGSLVCARPGGADWIPPKRQAPGARRQAGAQARPPPTVGAFNAHSGDDYRTPAVMGARQLSASLDIT